MRTAVIVLGVLAAFIVQTKLSLFGVSPDLTAVAAYYFGIKNGATKGMSLGSLVGIIEDSISGNILGPNLLGKGVIGFFSSFSSGSVFRWTPFLGMVSIFLLTVLDGVIVFLSRSLFQTPPTSLGAGLLILAVQGLLNLPLGFFIRPRNAE